MLGFMRTRKLTLMAACCLAGLWSPLATAETGKPNILLIYVDDMGYRELGDWNMDGAGRPKNGYPGNLNQPDFTEKGRKN